MSDLDLPCRYCGKRAGIACIQADGKARGTSHQIRRDDAKRWNEWKGAASEATRPVVSYPAGYVELNPTEGEVQ